MGKKDKLLARLLEKPKDFSWGELESLLRYLGFKLEKNKGSRRKFVHEEKRVVISLHEPHPEKTLKRYVIESVILKLYEVGVLDE